MEMTKVQDNERQSKSNENKEPLIGTESNIDSKETDVHYFERFEYQDNQDQVDLLPDDTSLIESDLKALKDAYLTGETRSAKFRIAQLKSLLKGLNEMSDEIC